MTRGRRCGGDDYRIAMQARIGRPRRVPQLTPNAVGNDVSEFHGAAGREVLAAFEESSEDKHRKADYDSTPPITESDHPAGMTPSGKQPKCCSLSQMSRRLIATMRGDAAGAREPMTTQQISTAQRTGSRVVRRGRTLESRRPCLPDAGHAWCGIQRRAASLFEPPRHCR